MTNTMRDYLALGDYGKSFTADVLAVHVDDETLAYAVHVGQLAETFKDGASALNPPLAGAEKGAAPKITGGEWSRFLNPGVREEPYED
jgi:hypothetical protein